MWTRRWMWIVWPAFLAAAVLEVLVFAAFDPHDMVWWGQSVELSRMAIYTGAFFVFWAVAVVAGFLTVLLSLSPTEVNGQPGWAQRTL
jgi:thiamine transporter ThiT